MRWLGWSWSAHSMEEEHDVFRRYAERRSEDERCGWRGLSRHLAANVKRWWRRHRNLRLAGVDADAVLGRFPP